MDLDIIKTISFSGIMLSRPKENLYIENFVQLQTVHGKIVQCAFKQVVFAKGVQQKLICGPYQ